MNQEEAETAPSIGVSASGLVCWIIACTVILVLSKDEKPHVPLRAYIAGQICAFALGLILLFTSLLSESLQAISGCLQIMLGCFSLGWLIAGCVWVSMAFATRSDALILFWGSMAFIILAASGIAVCILFLAAGCCCCVSVMACCAPVMAFFARDEKALHKSSESPI